MDMLARTFRTRFTIEILPLNDNPPVIKLFTLDDCSVNSVMDTVGSKKRRNIPRQSENIKDHSKLQLEHHTVMQLQVACNHVYSILFLHCSCRLTP